MTRYVLDVSAALTWCFDDEPEPLGLPDAAVASDSEMHVPSQWPLELLNDHAHLEKKAATNALELLNRWPEPAPPENWVAAMTAISRDEVEHLGLVCRILARRACRQRLWFTGS